MPHSMFNTEDELQLWKRHPTMFVYVAECGKLYHPFETMHKLIPISSYKASLI